jgi:hypothetical protein
MGIVHGGVEREDTLEEHVDLMAVFEPHDWHTSFRRQCCSIAVA